MPMLTTYLKKTQINEQLFKPNIPALTQASLAVLFNARVKYTDFIIGKPKLTIPPATHAEHRYTDAYYQHMP